MSMRHQGFREAVHRIDGAGCTGWLDLSGLGLNDGNLLALVEMLGNLTSHAMLRQQDHTFADLHRVTDTHGRYLWVHRLFLPIYQPPLPETPTLKRPPPLIFSKNSAYSPICPPRNQRSKANKTLLTVVQDSPP